MKWKKMSLISSYAYTSLPVDDMINNAAGVHKQLPPNQIL